MLDYFGWLLGASCVLNGVCGVRALAWWAGMAPGGEGRCIYWCPIDTTCFLCLGPKWFWAVCPGTHCSDLAGRPEHLDRAPNHPKEVEVEVNNGSHRHLQPQEFLQLWKAPMVSQASLFNLLLFRSCLFSPQLSWRSNWSLYMCIFELFMGRGKVIVFLCYRSLGALKNYRFMKVWFSRTSTQFLNVFDYMFGSI